MARTTYAELLAQYLKNNQEGGADAFNPRMENEVISQFLNNGDPSSSGFAVDKNTGMPYTTYMDKDKFTSAVETASQLPDWFFADGGEGKQKLINEMKRRYAESMNAGMVGDLNRAIDYTKQKSDQESAQGQHKAHQKAIWDKLEQNIGDPTQFWGPAARGGDPNMRYMDYLQKQKAEADAIANARLMYNKPAPMNAAPPPAPTDRYNGPFGEAPPRMGDYIARDNRNPDASKAKKMNWSPEGWPKDKV